MLGIVSRSLHKVQHAWTWHKPCGSVKSECRATWFCSATIGGTTNETSAGSIEDWFGCVVSATLRYRQWGMLAYVLSFKRAMLRAFTRMVTWRNPHPLWCVMPLAWHTNCRCVLLSPSDANHCGFQNARHKRHSNTALPDETGRVSLIVQDASMTMCRSWFRMKAWPWVIRKH